MGTITREISLKSTSKDRLDSLQPCYLFSADKFYANARSFISAFKETFDDFTLAYSTKTCPHMLVLSELRQVKGANIEIVSPRELFLAKLAGFEDNEIVYNGVIPDDENKFRIAAHGGIVNLENPNEVRRLAELAFRTKTRIEVGLRVNLDIDESRKWKSRFGILPGTDAYKECFELQSDYFEIVGFHIHVHGCRSIEMWMNRAAKLGWLGKTVKNLKYLDFGSNMFGFMDDRLAAQFDTPIPTFQEYAKAIYHELNALYDVIPTIIIEAGTPIVADTMSVVGKVENIYERGFDTIATASCSVYDFGFFHGSDKKVPMDVVHRSQGKEYSNVEIFGYACTEDDTLCKSYSGRLAIGDLLIFRTLGAYAVSLRTDFIKTRMPVYAIDEILQE